MKKKLILIGIAIAAIVLLIGYWYFFRPRPFPSVETSFIMPVNEYGILAPDGSFMYTSLYATRDLQTGAEAINDFAYKHVDLAWSFLDVSPNGRYLTAISVENRNHNYLLDLEGKSYQENSYLCESWSGDSTRCLEALDYQLVDMPENKVVEEWNRNVDFRKLSHTSGDANTLWDMNNHIPVAQIIDNENVLSLASMVHAYRIFPYTDRTHTIILPILEIQPPREIVSFIFDPTGRYVLFAVWEHKGEYVKGDYDSSTVTDTALVLVDWRTKENKEIFRISTIDPAHVVASRGSSALQWSSDGSTILVSRCYTPGVPDVVLKLKYP